MGDLTRGFSKVWHEDNSCTVFPTEITDHDPGAADAFHACGPTYSNTQDILDRLHAAGWVLVQVNEPDATFRASDEGADHG